MNWKILAVGKPKFTYVQQGVEDYLQRLQIHARTECLYVRDAAALMSKSEGSFRVVLDERGQQWSSTALAQQVANWEVRSIKTVSVLIGPADGHDDLMRQRAEVVWSLSKLTLPHEMALLLVVEQIYRAYTIKAGTPYHRE